MINKLELCNFGNQKHVAWNNLGKINLIIGENGSGKTFLLKAMYCSIKTIEDYRRGDDKRNESEILSERLYWTFQTDKIGDIVSKSADTPLSCEIENDKKLFRYGFGKDTSKKVQTLTNRTDTRSSNSIFLPSKEVLSLFQIILKSREQDKVFGFDDTYLDLVRALRSPPTKGKTYPGFKNSKEKLGDLLGGRIEFDSDSNRWYFKRGNQKFAIGVTAEGIKKIAIIDTLLANRYLNSNSIVFIDEPESALHPTAISQLLEIVSTLAECGIQFFLASHSYFVIKKLYLIANQQKLSIPCIILNKDGEARYDDLQKGIPDNSIIDESIRLYMEEVGGVLK